MPHTEKNRLKRSAPSAIRKRKIITALLRWYREHGRQLPWRDEENPYRVLLSEVMLQQTQVSRVMTKYPEFLRRFPSFPKLAMAKSSEVIRTWRGMGYNSRALRLHRLAAIVVTDFGGILPQHVDVLRTLPGIGRYTAHAVACFAFGENVPVVDTNIIRVFGRLYPIRNGTPSVRPDDLWSFASLHLPRSNAPDWNQALMDLGATICTAARPRCPECPLFTLCPSASKQPRKPAHRTSSEPGRNGIPNRIYRGKAVEILRDLRPGTSMSSSSLARRILSGYGERDERWFHALLKGLERDGLVRLRGRSRISLPE